MLQTNMCYNSKRISYCIIVRLDVSLVVICVGFIIRSQFVVKKEGSWHMQWAVAVAAFLASAVEFVEAFTIVLVVGVTINWRSAIIGTLAAVVALAIIVAIFGVTLVQYIPIDVLRLVVGTILILFGLKWLKKALLRYSGLKALHDEEAIFEETIAELRAKGEVITSRLEPTTVALAFKSVLLEGLEVAFIVITFGSNAAAVAANGGIN